MEHPTKTTIKMTTAQFARLHHINKRTLHYYDNIGLFSPRYRGENNYRYYDYMQSIDLEYIRMLKELNMGIDEIRDFLENPNEQDFLQLADNKIQEIDQEIQKLEKTKNILTARTHQLKLCRQIAGSENSIPEIHMISCEEETYLVTPFTFEENDLQKLLFHVRDVWDVEQYRIGIGSYISVDKIKAKNFQKYDGLFTPMQQITQNADIVVRPKGMYLCGYHRGSWDNLPELYYKIIDFAEERHLKLTGYAYETGLNDFAISNMEDYVTQVIVKVE